MLKTYSARGTCDFANDIGEDDVVIRRIVDQFAPLAILAQSHIIALERVSHAADVRLLPVLEQETSRHLLAHSVAADLVETHSISMALYIYQTGF